MAYYFLSKLYSKYFFVILPFLVWLDALQVVIQMGSSDY